MNVTPGDWRACCAAMTTAGLDVDEHMCCTYISPARRRARLRRHARDLDVQHRRRLGQREEVHRGGRARRREGQALPAAQERRDRRHRRRPPEGHERPVAEHRREAFRDHVAGLRIGHRELLQRHGWPLLDQRLGLPPGRLVSPPPVLIRKTSPELIVSNLQTRRATCPQLFMHNYTLYANARYLLSISFFKHAMR